MKNAAKTTKLLAKLVTFEGRTITRAAWIEHLAANGGYRVQRLTVPKYKYDRRTYNRMDGNEQDAYNKKMSETKEVLMLVSPSGEYFDINQTEADYFMLVSRYY